MKAWLMALIASRRPQPVNVPFDKNGTLVVPAGVSSVDMSGYGAHGTDGSSGVLPRWMKTNVNVEYMTNGETRRTYTDQGYVYSTPGDSCGPRIPVMNGTVDYVQSCTIYQYDPLPFNAPPTTGASATAIGKTFPGSYRNTTPAVTTFKSVPVTGGASYNIVVPADGLVTVTYYL